MRKFGIIRKLFLGVGILFFSILSCTAEKELAKDVKINIKVNGRVLTALLYNNSSAKALIALLEGGDVTINMHDFSNFEKVGELPISLPRNDEHLKTDAGDLILYLGKKFVIYYDKNEWDFTPLGKLENISKEELKIVLGKGDVIATLSIAK